MYKSSSQTRGFQKPLSLSNQIRNDNQYQGLPKKNSQLINKGKVQKPSPKFFEKMLLEHHAPKTYQHFHQAKKFRPSEYKYLDMDYSAKIIQNGWKQFKRTKLVNKIQILENTINAYSSLDESRKNTNYKEISRRSNFETFIIERLLLDFHICNQIIESLKNEFSNLKEDSTKQSQEVRSVLEEYILYIDVILKEKTDLEAKVFDLQQQHLINENRQSQIINPSRFNQMSDKQSQSALEEIKQNIFNMANSVNLQITKVHSNENEIMHAIKEILQKKDNVILEKDAENKLLRQSLQSLSENLMKKQYTGTVKDVGTDVQSINNNDFQSQVIQHKFEEGKISNESYTFEQQVHRNIQSQWSISLEKLKDF